jgi:hypothetical protein
VGSHDDVVGDGGDGDSNAQHVDVKIDVGGGRIGFDGGEWVNDFVPFGRWQLVPAMERKDDVARERYVLRGGIIVGRCLQVHRTKRAYNVVKRKRSELKRVHKHLEN